MPDKSQPSTGWWEQDQHGRQYMQGLRMMVGDHRITGSGMDVIGAFTFDGTLSDDNEVEMVKDYFDQHQVTYRGQYDGSTRLWGTWHLPSDQGAWEITLGSEAEGAEVEKEARAAEPLEL